MLKQRRKVTKKGQVVKVLRQRRGGRQIRCFNSYVENSGSSRIKDFTFVNFRHFLD
jgi:hypothetical protein